MKFRLILALLTCLTFSVFAQEEQDSLFVIKKNNKWAVKYIIKPGENLHMLARRFHVSEGLLEETNYYAENKKMPVGTMILIPVGDNFSKTRTGLHAADFKEIYYKVGERDDIALISSYSGVTKDEMRVWNNMKGYTLPTDRAMLVGYVKYLSLDSSNPATFLAYPVPKKTITVQQQDTVKIPVPGGLDTIYNRQTNNGINVLSEKGTVVFFEAPAKGSSSVYMAFHNGTPRGTIIKIFNPGSGKTTYAKVLGPLPATKLYSGAIIGISDAAREALGVNDTKAWCELTYVPN